MNKVLAKRPATFNDFLKYMKEVGYQWITPDDFYERGSITFIYTTIDGLLYDEFPKTHGHIARENGINRYSEDGQLFGRIANETTTQVIYYDLRHTNTPDFEKWLEENGLEADDDNLFNFRIAAFWNKKKSDLLGECCQALLKEGLIGPNDIITNFFGIVDLAKNISQSTQSKSIDPEQSSRIEQWKKLHLMRGDEKKQAMQDLGLASGAKNKWQNSLEKRGHLTPGHKWWAPYSENISFRDWLNNEQSNDHR